MAIPIDTKPHWYVVHTYSGYEKKVAGNLKKIIENRGLQNVIFDVQVPIEKVVEVTSSGEKEIERNLFPSYVLVKMIMNEENWHIIRNTTGVTGFVGPGSSPVALTDKEVEKLGVEATVIEIKFSVGDNVRIENGPLIGQIGLVEAISSDKKRVNVSVPMFGRETKVELDVSQVTPI